MKFGLMYEINMPKPWYEGQEHEKYWQVMAQIQYAEEMGFDYTWAVEHHCLEEFSHCSAPEILFAAASQRTSTMRFGHGAVLLGEWTALAPVYVGEGNETVFSPVGSCRWRNLLGHPPDTWRTTGESF